jgi:hypothetical protein
MTAAALVLWDRARRRSVADLRACLGGCEVSVLKAGAIRAGGLTGVEVLPVPGGSGSKQAEEVEICYGQGPLPAAAGSFGKGRVFCFSPHPEKTNGLHPFVERAVEWAAGRRGR